MTNVAMIIPQITFLLKIASISNLTDFISPEVLVHGVPWKINVEKSTIEEEQYLSVYLHCGIEDKSPDWSHAAEATFKLMPLSGNNSGIERNITPFVFDSAGVGYGFPSFINWNELFTAENNYVKDDTLTLEVKIEVADPKNPSRLLLETIEQSCDEGCSNKYRLNVTNIDSLMAAKSSEFKIRNLSWNFVVFKSNSHLGVALGTSGFTSATSCKLKVLLKIISTKDDIQAIEPDARDKTFEKLHILKFEDIISWNELLKPENGFANHNSIVIEVEVKSSKPEGVIANNRNEPGQLKLSCPICMKPFTNQELSSTQCGHLYCSACITRSIQARQKCPICNADVTLDSLHRVYLPIAH